MRRKTRADDRHVRPFLFPARAPIDHGQTLRPPRFAIALISTIVACVAAEGATRLIDGYKLWSLRLTAVRPRLARTTALDKWLDPRRAEAYVSVLPVADGVDRSWFGLDPEQRLPTPVDPELERRYWPLRGHERASVDEWNLQFIRN